MRRAVLDGAVVAGLRQARLLELLACPNCLSPLSVDDAITLHDAVVDGRLDCVRCGPVGLISDRRPSFLPPGTHQSPVPRGTVAEAVDLAVAAGVGHWTDTGHGLLGDGVGAAISGVAVGLGVRFELGTHAWSGRVAVRCGVDVRTVDLYSAEPGSTIVELADDRSAAREWSLTLIDDRSPSSLGDQVIVREVAVLVPATEARPRPFEAMNRGNPYPARFDALVKEQALDAVALDVGGGDRVHPDARVLNFEYLPYKGPDFYGDGLHMPVASDSVDLILSQAVLEHVNDPQAAVAEMWRILRPGGVAYVEIAFMQPLHAVPFHFFNVTPHGRDHLFADFDVIDRGSFGGLAVTLGWFFRLVSAAERIGPAADDVLRTLAVLDASLSAGELEQFASAVYVEARKPPA